MNETLVKQMAAIEHQINYISTDLSEKILQMLNRISVSSDKLSENIRILAEKKPEIIKMASTEVDVRETVPSPQVDQPSKGLFKRFINR